MDLDTLHEAAKRLQKVWIERLAFAEVIRKYDGPETVLYLDPLDAPPEFASGVCGWPDEEHDRLKQILDRVKGRSIMSYPDWPRFRDLYADCTIEAIRTRYRVFVRTGVPASWTNSSSGTTTRRPSAGRHGPASRRRWWTPTHTLERTTRRGRELLELSDQVDDLSRFDGRGCRHFERQHGDLLRGVRR